jgi:hypothetical protein
LQEHTNFLTVLKLESALPNIGIGNLKLINTDPKLSLQAGVGTEFLCLKCRKILKLRKILHYLCGILAGTTKKKPKMWENIKSRKFKLGFHYVCVHI